MSQPLDRQEIRGGLLKKGFMVRRGDHEYLDHLFEGKETGPFTKLSHSKKLKDYTGDLLLAMKRQLQLDNIQQVRDLVKCPMTQEGFEALLRSKSIIPDDTVPAPTPVNVETVERAFRKDKRAGTPRTPSGDRHS